MLPPLLVTHTLLGAHNVLQTNAPLPRSEKDAEVSSLKQAVAERDVKLKSAKGELLEARMSLQQKDSELKVGPGWSVLAAL